MGLLIGTGRALLGTNQPIYTQNWDGVIPPAIPANWKTDAHISTSVAHARSAPNGLVASTGDAGAGHFVFYQTKDAFGGNVAVSSAFYITGAFLQGNVVARCSNTVSASFNGYALVVQSATAVTLYKVTAGAFTSIATGGGTAITTATWYRTTLTCSGPTITATVQRDSDGLFLTSGGTWSATPQAAVTVTDTTYGAVAGYSGVGFYSASSNTIYSDDFSLASS